MIDVIAGVPCTLVDNGMPVVVMRAAAVGITGYESCGQLESNAELRALLEQVRLQAGNLMNLGDVSDATVPKLTMVAAARHGGQLSTRTFIPHRCHEAIGVLGAVSVATAALLPGSRAADLMAAADVAVAGTSTGDTAKVGTGTVILEHPTGSFEAAVSIHIDGDSIVVERAGIIRTARKLMDGTVYPRQY